MKTVRYRHNRTGKHLTDAELAKKYNRAARLQPGLSVAGYIDAAVSMGILTPIEKEGAE